MSKKAAICQGCKLEFESRNAVFRHLKETNGQCLPPEEHETFLQFVLKQQRDRVVLLYGYLADLEEEGPIQDGDDAARILLEVILSEENGGDSRAADTPESTKNINRSYGNVSMSTPAVKQDKNTSAMSELLSTKLAPLTVPIQNWIDRINIKLKERLGPGPRPQIRLLGRQNIPQSKFNAELDITHRRVEYLLPADMLYGDGISPDVGTDQFMSSREAFFYALPSFVDGTFDHDLKDTHHNIKCFDENGMRIQEKITEEEEKLRFPLRRPDLPTLRYLHSLKKKMQKLTTHIVPLDASKAGAVKQTSINEQERGKSKKLEVQRSQKQEEELQGHDAKEKPTKKQQSKNGNNGHDDAKEKPTKKQQSKNGSSKSKGKSVDSRSGPNILKRRRFHNFTPTVMAHEYRAYRRMDRFYHRATLRFSQKEGKVAADDDNDSLRPFIVSSITGDMFLHGQVCRVMGVFIAIARGLVDTEIVDCLFDEDFAHLIPTPPAPLTGMYASEAFYVNYEGKINAVLTARKCNRFEGGWCDDDTVRRVYEWRDEVRLSVAEAWYARGVDKDGRLTAEREWTKEVLEPWAEKANAHLVEYRQWKAARELVKTAGSASEETKGEVSPVSSLLPSLDNICVIVPALYEKVLACLRDADASGKWPSTTPKRQMVMVSTVAENAELSDADRTSLVATSLEEAHMRAKQNNRDSRISAYMFAEGEGGASGSFSVGAMPGEQCIQPKSNSLFPELMKAAFELEIALMPNREPSSTIAINRNAQFRPHVDNGAGAGQSTSLIVGLGTYSGGELVVEGERKDIRYNAVEFNGWKQRHWTMPFKGERYSLVWFTPKGCEGVRGIDMCN